VQRHSQLGVLEAQELSHLLHFGGSLVAAVRQVLAFDEADVLLRLRAEHHHRVEAGRVETLDQAGAAQDLVVHVRRDDERPAHHGTRRFHGYGPL
jgi:hypothetical protein